jgi:hypothetical protein
MFRGHPELPGLIGDWFRSTLIETPGRAPVGLASAARPPWGAILKDLETPGGVGRGEKTLAEARRSDPNARLWPELAVTIMGYDQLAAGDPKLAVAILKLNVAAHTRPADAHDSLSDAYLADGQKGPAREHRREGARAAPVRHDGLGRAEG